MKKLIIFSFVLFLLISFNPVKAYEISDDLSYRVVLADEEKKDCRSIFGDPTKDGTVANFMQDIFNTAKWLVIILCIVLTIIDFIKAVVSEKKEDLSKMTVKTLKRIVLSLIFFFIPSLINLLFHLFGWYGTCGIG